MYISIRDNLVKHAGFDTVVDGLRALGLACVEVEVGRDFQAQSLDGDNRYSLTSDEELAAFRTHLNEVGIRICAFLMANDFNSADPEAEIAWVATVVEAAGKLAIPSVRIDSAMSGQDEMELSDRVRIFSDSLGRIISETASQNVQLGIENHSSKGNDPDFLDGVLEEVASPRLGLTLDTGNFYWSGIPLAKVYKIIEHFAPVVKHTHVKNINYPIDQREKQRPAGWEYMKYVSPLDEGDIDHNKVVQLLRAAGYSGDLTIEDESLGKFPVEERPSILQRDVKYLKDVL